MSTLTLPTRQAIESAEPLSFDGPRPALATLAFHGVPVQLDVCALTEQTLKDIERRVSRLLERDGWRAPTAAPAPSALAKTKKAAAEPHYRDDGTPCCPKHQKPLKEGRFGLYCPAKDESGKNGYCDLKFP